MLIETLLAIAAVQATPTPTNMLVDALARCLTIAADDARLACHDAAARKLVSAERNREVVLIDKEQVRRTRRSLFGLSLGTADPITGQDDPAARVESLSTTIATYAAGRNGRWVMTFAEGGRWQTSEEWGGGGEPRRGAPVTLRRGALGSYVMKMEGARAVRVQRIN